MQLKQQTLSSSQQQRLEPWFMELDWSISSLQTVDFSWCPLCRHVEQHGLLIDDPALMAFSYMLSPNTVALGGGGG